MSLCDKLITITGNLWWIRSKTFKKNRAENTNYVNSTRLGGLCRVYTDVCKHCTRPSLSFIFCVVAHNSCSL